MSSPLGFKPHGKSKGRLIIISAPSGTGKTSVIRRLIKTHPNMIHSISCTTRPKRPGEVDGRDYHFIGEKVFHKMIAENAFAEYAKVHHFLYGTPKAPLKEALGKGLDVLLDLDVQGGMNLKRMYAARALSIFLLPPSVEELEKRLSKRGTDSEAVVQVRLENSRQEMACKDDYDVRLINENLEQTCLEIEKLLK